MLKPIMALIDEYAEARFRQGHSNYQAEVSKLREEIETRLTGQPTKVWRYQPNDHLKHPAFTEYESIAIGYGKPGSVVPLITHPDYVSNV